jgi:hypothetical protein
MRATLIRRQRGRAAEAFIVDAERKLEDSFGGHAERTIIIDVFAADGEEAIDEPILRAQ